MAVDFSIIYHAFLFGSGLVAMKWSRNLIRSVWKREVGSHLRCAGKCYFWVPKKSGNTVRAVVCCTVRAGNVGTTHLTGGHMGQFRRKYPTHPHRVHRSPRLARCARRTALSSGPSLSHSAIGNSQAPENRCDHRKELQLPVRREGYHHVEDIDTTL